MPSQLPTLSIVATARNDNHGGNLLRRFSIFANGVIAQAERHKVFIELIIVDWNPPAEKSGLDQAITWKKNSEYCTTRIVTFPRELHTSYRHASQLPLYQMIAKNVGVRRAKAPFVLATNIDIVFSDALFEFFAAGKLCRHTIYRVDRYDVDENLPANLPIEETLKFCQENIIRLNHRRGSISTKDAAYFRHYADDVDFMREELLIPNLYTNACGDFQLMARQHWFELRGYPEFDMYSFHIDSIFEYMAHYLGLTEEYLGAPFRIYHIEHESGWTPEAQKNGTFDSRYAAQQIQKLSDQELRQYILQMKQKRAPTLFNNSDWGWASSQLPEVTL